ncbi:hypothetical protein [Tenacibaculum ovolyticum]|uniref:hypothetical protein n=1 Tax=Tenacibaculum ovolyticum TaxID=104270 RepID=UPI001F424BB3|nr:hypothetical protein [Tenacibaculum ovolyticum]
MSTAVTMSQENQKALQFALNLNEFKEVIEKKSNNDKYLPIVLATGRRVSLDLKVTAFNEKVIVVDDKEDSELVKKDNHIPIEMGKAYVRESKAEYLFFFKDAKIIIKLSKKNNKWILKKFVTKKRNKFSYLFDF